MLIKNRDRIYSLIWQSNGLAAGSRTNQHRRPLRRQNTASFLTLGSVATRLKCGKIANDRFIANFLQSVPVK